MVSEGGRRQGLNVKRQTSPLSRRRKPAPTLAAFRSTGSMFAARSEVLLCRRQQADGKDRHELDSANRASKPSLTSSDASRTSWATPPGLNR